MLCTISLSVESRPTHPVSGMAVMGVDLPPVLSGLRSSAERHKMPRLRIGTGATAAMLSLVLPCRVLPGLLYRLDDMAALCILPVTALQEQYLQLCLSPGAKDCHCLLPLLQGAWPWKPPASARRAVRLPLPAASAAGCMALEAICFRSQSRRTPTACCLCCRVHGPGTHLLPLTDSAAGSGRCVVCSTGQ